MARPSPAPYYTFAIPANTLSGTVSGQADTLTATYSGDSNYAASTGTGSVTVLASGLSLAPGTPSLSSVTPGQSVTEAVTISATNGYTGTVSLSCAQTSTTATNSDGTTCQVASTSSVNLDLDQHQLQRHIRHLHHRANRRGAGPSQVAGRRQEWLAGRGLRRRARPARLLRHPGAPA